MIKHKKNTVRGTEYNREHNSWTTKDEIAFIDGLGKHTSNALPRIVLLAKYLNTITTIRVNFDRIDKKEIIDYVNLAIEQESI